MKPPYTYNRSNPLTTAVPHYVLTRNENVSSTNPPNTNVCVYKGNHYSPPLSKYPKCIPTITKVYDVKWIPVITKVVVFDLDETIGNFSDLYLIWTAIFKTGIYNGTPDQKTIQSIFNELLDLYPEFLRYGILHILDFIRTKIQNGESHRIYLYTNNQCDFTACTDSRDPTQPSPTEWVEMIIMYLNMKIRATNTIFAKPICAFKIGNRIIEPLRKSRSKTHMDFLKCAVLPKNTEICFVDDTYHSKMAHNKVYYIQPPPYYHELSQATIIDRFMVSSLYSKLHNLHTGNHTFESVFVKNSFCEAKPIVKHETICVRGITGDDLPSKVSKVIVRQNPDHNKEIYNKMMYYIKEFFCISAKTPPTRRKTIRIGKFTRRKMPHR